MEFVDYYKVLGVGKSATAEEIKAAYRKMARKLHPDLNPNDKDAKAKFQRLNEAHEVLSDPEKRKKYDLYGKDYKYAGESSGDGFHGGRPYTYGDDNSDFSDFFRSMFEGMGGGRGPVKFRGEDISAELHLNLRDVLHPRQQILSVNSKQIRITIPAGVENGQTLTIAGQGGPGMNGGPAGDLYVTFVIADDPHFRRVGPDLYKTVEIDLYTALLGGEVTVETMHGDVKLKVQPETQNGAKVKLKGKGFAVFKRDGEFGDLYVTFSVRLPQNLTVRQKELFSELAGRKG